MRVPTAEFEPNALAPTHGLAIPVAGLRPLRAVVRPRGREDRHARGRSASWTSVTTGATPPASTEQRAVWTRDAADQRRPGLRHRHRQRHPPAGRGVATACATSPRRRCGRSSRAPIFGIYMPDTFFYADAGEGLRHDRHRSVPHAEIPGPPRADHDPDAVRHQRAHLHRHERPADQLLRQSRAGHAGPGREGRHRPHRVHEEGIRLRQAARSSVISGGSAGCCTAISAIRSSISCR